MPPMSIEYAVLIPAGTPLTQSDDMERHMQPDDAISIRTISTKPTPISDTSRYFLQRPAGVWRKALDARSSHPFPRPI